MRPGLCGVGVLDCAVTPGKKGICFLGFLVLFSNPWGKKHILFGLNGSIIGAQKPKKVKTYATERPRVC